MNLEQVLTRPRCRWERAVGEDPAAPEIQPLPLPPTIHRPVSSSDCCPSAPSGSSGTEVRGCASVAPGCLGRVLQKAELS